MLGATFVDANLTFQSILSADSVNIAASVLTLIVPILSLSLCYVKWKAKKPKVKILIEEKEAVASTQPTGHIGPPFTVVEWQVRIFNTGAVKVTMISFGVELKKSNEKPIYFKRGIDAMKELEPTGRPYGGRFSLQPIIKELRERGYSGLVKVTPFVEDGAGIKYKSNLIIIDTKKFVESTDSKS